MRGCARRIGRGAVARGIVEGRIHQHGVGTVGHEPDCGKYGGVSLDVVRTIAETGVDLISVGALTHSAPTLDFSMLIELA